ncbi:MAG TPA: DUF1015 domain-containing protein [Candidatus Binataceae bacterium]|nr:DUF1015 domain-containing protein [Candidatus Binataceae bacterium]
MDPRARRIEPFRGLLYNPSRSGPLHEVIAPPYDLIDGAMQERLYQRSPYNVVRVELARGADRYQAAAQTLREWIDRGVLTRPAHPAIYLYRQRFAIAGRTLTRSGFIVRLRLENFGPGRILPHERTFPAAKEDRLRLLTATETNISSIFGLYAGQHPQLDALRARVAAREPLLAATDDLQIENELHAIADVGEIASIQEALETPRILIADGHHRYETALEYRRLRRAADGDPAEPQPYDYVLMTLVAWDDPGLVILATHRVVRGLDAEALASFAARARELFEIEETVDRDRFRERLKAAGQGAIGVALRNHPGLQLLRLKDRAAMESIAPGAPPAVRELDVSILHGAILERIFGIGPEQVRAGGNIEYTIDFDGALNAVEGGAADGAFLMNPPSIVDVERVSDAGATMPEKSTYFFPKLATGLVINPVYD